MEKEVYFHLPFWPIFYDRLPEIDLNEYASTPDVGGAHHLVNCFTYLYDTNESLIDHAR